MPRPPKGTAGTVRTVFKTAQTVFGTTQTESAERRQLVEAQDAPRRGAGEAQAQGAEPRLDLDPAGVPAEHQQQRLEDAGQAAQQDGTEAIGGGEGRGTREDSRQATPEEAEPVRLCCKSLIFRVRAFHAVDGLSATGALESLRSEAASDGEGRHARARHGVLGRVSR